MRHKFAPRRLLGTGRRASRTAFPRGALERSFKNVQHRNALVIEGSREQGDHPCSQGDWGQLRSFQPIPHPIRLPSPAVRSLTPDRKPRSLKSTLQCDDRRAEKTQGTPTRVATFLGPHYPDAASNETSSEEPRMV
ncbi:hypothetical protein CCL09_17930 [Pseudomonas congelans]|nr:hypothetical protein CCL07_26675 [Pseudomonas congelans]PBQ15794.1 hypothetical protein CCL09_17930 [Pseudomonas congelans]QVX18028.1 DUF1534 domain-containing protein [Pseudomonas congelans]